MNLLSSMWQAIQEYLFPLLEEDYGSLSDREEKLVRIMEIIRIERYITEYPGWRGRPRDSRTNIARAFMVKAVYNLSSTRHLLDLLQNSPFLRRMCGYEKKTDIPCEATFSRAFHEFAQRGILEIVQKSLIKNHLEDQLLGHISRDSSAIEGNEKAAKSPGEKKAEKVSKKRGRPKKGEEKPESEPSRLEKQKSRKLEENIKDLPDQCDWGVKKNSQGKTEQWCGFKLHVDSVDGGIPISCILTSASLHDSQVAIPLSQMSSERVVALYELMDAAYDAEPIRKFVITQNRVPIIDSNPRRGEKVEMDPPKAERYKERSSSERVFSRLKEEFGARHVRVRGAKKVFTHLMFGVIALVADQLFRRFI